MRCGSSHWRHGTMSTTIWRNMLWGRDFALVAFMVLLGQLGAAYVISRQIISCKSRPLPRLAGFFVHCLVCSRFRLLSCTTLRGLFPFAAFGLAVLLAGLTLVGVHGVSMVAEQIDHRSSHPCSPETVLQYSLVWLFFHSSQ